MKLVIVAVGQKMPDWAQTAFDDYAKRFPPDLRLECRTVKTEPRSGGKTTAQMMQAEAQRIESAIDAGCHKGRRIVALDERGTPLTTKALAERLRANPAISRALQKLAGVFLIGFGLRLALTK